MRGNNIATPHLTEHQLRQPRCRQESHRFTSSDLARPARVGVCEKGIEQRKLINLRDLVLLLLLLLHLRLLDLLQRRLLVLLRRLRLLRDRLLAHLLCGRFVNNRLLLRLLLLFLGLRDALWLRLLQLLLILAGTIHRTITISFSIGCEVLAGRHARGELNTGKLRRRQRHILHLCDNRR